MQFQIDWKKVLEVLGTQLQIDWKSTYLGKRQAMLDMGDLQDRSIYFSLYLPALMSYFKKNGDLIMDLPHTMQSESKTRFQ